jgi:hypothetical protein
LEELDDEIREMVEAVKDEEELEIQDVYIKDNSTITIKAKEKEFIILPKGEDQGEELAREYLENGEFWEMATSDGHTLLGLDDWIDDVLSIGGWENELCSYDGRVRYTTTTEGREVVYYRYH